MFCVLLSVYKKEKPEYFHEAFSSIWFNQQLKPDQIVLVKDGPLTPELNAVIMRWKEILGDVITIVNLSKNAGLGAALNAGIKLCKYELIARMDTDDVAFPDRFEKQVSFMIEHPEIAVSSGQIEEWDQGLCKKLYERHLPLKHEDIVIFAKKRSPISHPAVIFRKSAVQEVNGYPKIYPEDFPLWVSMIVAGYKFANLPDFVLKMRVGDALMKRRGRGFLKGEVSVFRHMLRLGFIDKPQFIYNVASRAAVRLSPWFAKKIFYRSFR
ncbi:glycosyltransferase [Modicisalibacter luteus]|uniref:Glycosyltransferase n=1 Tax=Modicisalibacter luteus TaxID=453962 RepID=A0ABV7M5A5_9GAMM|nr:glycosyltransferase [Halomonas lutea]GHA88648.1 glycosyl transferase [Halomonas lutea]